MNKIKTSKSILKRFRVTSRGNLMRHKASRSHLLQKKTSKRKQNLRKSVPVNTRDLANFINRLPYINVNY